jgi:hypothetical protein
MPPAAVIGPWNMEEQTTAEDVSSPDFDNVSHPRIVVRSSRDLLPSTCHRLPAGTRSRLVHDSDAAGLRLVATAAPETRSSQWDELRKRLAKIEADS